MSEQIYKVHINDRGYTSWTFFTTTDFQPVELSINPIEHKLMTNDVFSIDETNHLKILHSSVRISDAIPGVLILKNNKTYGRNRGGGKLLYKCIPDDMRLPSFLVPYEIKNMGFSKIFTNLYVTFQFKDWDGKHPTALLTQVIGPVDVLDNFYEYQLYCKSLNASIQKFTKDASKALRTNSHDAFIENITKRYKSIEDRTDKTKWQVFTIDPEGSLDYDDGFSIKTLEHGIQQLSIYISNVTIWMDVLNLWNRFQEEYPQFIYRIVKDQCYRQYFLTVCAASNQITHD